MTQKFEIAKAFELVLALLANTEVPKISTCALHIILFIMKPLLIGYEHTSDPPVCFKYNKYFYY